MARVNANPDRFNKMEYTRLLKKAKGDSRSQRSFAMEAGISVPHMCKMLNGVFDVPPTQTTLRKIATVAVGGGTYAQLMKVCGYDVASEEKEFYPSIYMTPSQPKKITEPLREPVDLLLLGNSYYAFTIDPEVRSFIRSLDKSRVGKIVNFGSAAMLNSTWKKVKAEADKAGIPMLEKEFHCRGEFRGIHKGRPNAEDLAAARAFARSLKE